MMICWTRVAAVEMEAVKMTKFADEVDMNMRKWEWSRIALGF